MAAGRRAIFHKMLDKDQVARLLADAHREAEPGIVRIVRLVSRKEAEPREPVKLLEVNPATSPSGVMPIAFAPDPPAIPFPSVVVEVTPEEYTRIARGQLPLPSDWSLETTLYDADVAA
jgi:hypothetical protein